MPPKAVTLAAFLPAQLKPPEQNPDPVQSSNGQPRPQRCRCEGPFDLCWRYPTGIPNAVCKPTWDRLLAPFQFKGREWTIVELRSLWPHTVQALNERLLKGRTERTLKDDLQDDLQVLVDLIQYSCKPHPRPPRAGMKTLIVQGRILAEAIAQDALFQLDPSDPSAPRPDRDLVDLINRLRDHHPNSLLAPTLHVLRTLGNTAVHLDRDSARLTDAEIGDAAAVCCRFVVLVIDAYMQMCANLHRHEETEEALAQPLQETPAAPIPAPNVLLRPREAVAVAEEPVLIPHAPAPALATPVSQARQALHSTALRGHCATGGRAGGAEGGEDDDMSVRRDSGGGGSGGRRSGGGSGDGGNRVPYSLVSSDWAAAHPHLPAAISMEGGSAGCSTGGSPKGSSYPGSRGWWPPVTAGESLVLAVPLPMGLLRRQPFVDAGGSEAETITMMMTTGPPSLPQQPQAGSSVSNWLQGHPMPYGLPAGLWGGSAPPSGHFSRRSVGSNGSNSCGGAIDATCPPHGRPQPAVQRHPHGAGDAPPGQPRSADQPAGGSPRRSPISLTGVDNNGDHAAAIVPVRGSSPTPSHQSHPCLGAPARPAQLQPQQSSGLGSGGAAAASGLGGVSPSEASKRLLQLCATAQAPPLAKVQQLLHAGAALGVTDKSGMTALHMACYWCHAKAARLLLERHSAGAAAAAADREGRTPLWVASQRGHVELVELLLAAAGGAAGGAQVDAANAADVTPLRVAAAQGHTQVVQALLQAGANVHTPDKDGFSPLYVACARSHLEVARLLLAAGAPVDRAYKGQRTPLWAALHPGGSAKAETCPERRAAVVRALLSAGADVHLLPDVRDRDYCWQLLAQSIAAGE